MNCNEWFQAGAVYGGLVAQNQMQAQIIALQRKLIAAQASQVEALEARIAAMPVSQPTPPPPPASSSAWWKDKIVIRCALAVAIAGIMICVDKATRQGGLSQHARAIFMNAVLPMFPDEFRNMVGALFTWLAGYLEYGIYSVHSLQRAAIAGPPPVPER